MKYIRPINLWELLIMSKIDYPDHKEAIEALEETHWQEGQELSIQPTEEGWVIRIFSCFYSDDPSRRIRVLIARDGEVTVTRGVK